MNLRLTQTLRFKLLLASLSLLLVPWAGYHYVLEMESSLRHAQEELLLNRAEIVATMLAANSGDWLPETDTDKADPMHSLYIHPLDNDPEIDGYDEEWIGLKPQSRQFKANATSPDAVVLEWLAGFRGDSIYLMLEIHDQHLIYPRSERALDQGDHLILALPGPSGKSRKFRIGTPAPGWVNVVEYATNRQQTAIRGEWQESASGYRVELQIPRSLCAGHLSLAAVDIDELGAGPVGIAATSGWSSNRNLSRLVMPTMKVDKLLHGLDDARHRYTVLNKSRQVIGRHGRIRPVANPDSTLLRRLISLFSLSAGGAFFDAREGAGLLDGPEIRQSLAGNGAVYRYKTAGSKTLILSAAQPIRVDDRISGSVVVEQSTHEILLLQQNALERLFLISLVLFIVTAGILLLFATSLTRRIISISNKYNRAVSKDGRILDKVQAVNDRDELGQLDRSFSKVLERSSEYARYLESMASRLRHEFRTPLTMVQSSLENIRESGDSNAGSPYVERALDGTRRLNQILTRIGEATRLEQSLQNSEKEEIDVTNFCQSLCSGYAITYPHIAFNCLLPDHPFVIDLSPDLISQAMDKLISNAIDFHHPGSSITIEIDTGEKQVLCIKVRNRGPQIPEDELTRLFHTMESKRNSDGQQIHLGLGLYIVRLIAEFHQGSVRAENETDGVSFVIYLPYAS
jgi:dedicated sortase system histidine kinase